ncbi:TolC family protein [Roseivirga sp. BDSF3-8]|uniref:TolC family protein n=1 Tax=Roseivirga sp. BDSF3-8 TaxID=3241598 RepID=UPI0035319D8D
MKSIYFTLAIILFTAFTTTAQEKILSYDEAIDMAMNQNLTLKRERNNLILSRAEQRQAYLDLIPDVNGSVSGSRFNGNQFIQEIDLLVNQTVWNAGARVGAEATLFNGMRQLNSIHRGNTLRRAQDELVEWTAQDVIYNVSIQYMQVLLDKQLLVIAKENLEAQKNQAERIKGLVEAGARPIVDQYNQEAEVGRVQVEVVRGEAQLENDKAILGQLLMLNPSVEFDVVNPEMPVNITLYENTTIDELYEMALANRSDLKNLALLEEGARYQAKIAKGSLYPSLFLGWAAQTSYTDASPIGWEDQLKENNLQNQAYLSLSIPVFNGWRARTDVARARVQQENTMIDYQLQKRQVFTDLQQTYLDYAEALATFNLSEQRVIATQLAFDAQQERYKLGTATYVEFTEANRALAEAKANLAQAEITLRFQEIVLDYQTGNLAN